MLFTSSFTKHQYYSIGNRLQYSVWRTIGRTKVWWKNVKCEKVFLPLCYLWFAFHSIVMVNLCNGTDTDLIFLLSLFIRWFQLTGEDIKIALYKQIYHYSIYSSLFDVVLAALCRFTILLLFYALLYINHWCIISVSVYRFIDINQYFIMCFTDFYIIHVCIFSCKGVFLQCKYLGDRPF